MDEQAPEVDVSATQRALIALEQQRLQGVNPEEEVEDEETVELLNQLQEVPIGTMNIELSDEHMAAAYIASWIAKRVVDTVRTECISCRGFLL